MYSEGKEMAVDSKENCLEAILAVPFDEIKYYLLLTYSAIIEKNDDQYDPLLDELEQLSLKLSDLLSHNNGLSEETLTDICLHYQNLRTLSKTKGMGIKVGYALINLGSVLLAVLTGTVGTLSGVASGLIRSVWEFSNPFKNTFFGLVIGFSFGATVGFRAPKKLLKNEFTRQLMFSINGISNCLKQIQQESFLPIIVYKQEILNELLTRCFDEDKTALEEFLQAEHTIEIATFKAQFLSETLEGYLGHHACIKIDVPELKEVKLIEFSSSPSNFSQRDTSQTEKRQVTGEKIVEMLALHAQLQVNHTCNLAYQLTKMKPGENDCFSYVNKILLGTNQKATELRRFDGRENWVGQNIIGFFTKKLSPFSQEVFDGYEYDTVSHA